VYGFLLYTLSIAGAATHGPCWRRCGRATGLRWVSGGVERRGRAGDGGRGGVLAPHLLKGGTMDVDRVMMIAISDIVNEEPLDDVIEGLKGVELRRPRGGCRPPGRGG